MSAKQTTETKRGRGAPKKNITKARQNIYVTSAVLERAKGMAFAEGLSLSTWLEQLVRGKLEGSAL